MMTRLNLSFEQIRQFSTDVSHELRTPLTVVRGQLEVALFTAQTVEQYREAMVNALEDVDRLSNIVRALVDAFASPNPASLCCKGRRSISPNWCATRWINTRFRPKRKACDLTAELPRQPACIHADRIQIERLVSNLLGNAIKYTPAGGRVVVRLSVGRRLAIRFIVEDTGVGISPDHLPHIFDRFYRVPSADPEKGLGLGLSFVSWIVKAHGGVVTVESELHKGTRFTVSLPAGPVGPGCLEKARRCPCPSRYTESTANEHGNPET